MADQESHKPSRRLQAIEWQTSRRPRRPQIAFDREPSKVGMRHMPSQADPFLRDWSADPELVRRWDSATGSHWHACPKNSHPRSRLEERCSGDRCERRIHVTLRLSLAESRSDGSRIRHRTKIQGLNRSSESRFRRMAETACFVLIDGEMLIEEHQLSQGMDLSLTIKSGLVHLAQCVGLNAVDLGHDPGNVIVETRGHLTGKSVSGRDGGIMSLSLDAGREE